MQNSISDFKPVPLKFGMGIKYTSKKDYTNTVPPDTYVKGISIAPPRAIECIRISPDEMNIPTKYFIRMTKEFGASDFVLEKKIVDKLTEIGVEGFEYIPPVDGEAEK